MHNAISIEIKITIARFAIVGNCLTIQISSNHMKGLFAEDYPRSLPPREGKPIWGAAQQLS